MSQRERKELIERESARDRLCAELELPRSSPHIARALVHPSHTNEHGPTAGGDNQRLEFLGDAVLGLCVSELLMARFPSADEGELTVMRASLVSARALGAAARRLPLSAALLMGRGAHADHEHERTNVLADTLEALIGAVYLEEGLEAARRLTARVVAEGLERLVAHGGVERDPKSQLQERVQVRGGAPPRYEVRAVVGPDHARRFEVEVSVPWQDEWIVAGRGEGRAKKTAEQEAARSALAWLDARQSEPPMTRAD
jgi:ribonuclease-3